MLKQFKPHLSRHFLEIYGEITLVILWAFWVGRDLLNFNINWWPTGMDFPLAIRENFFWLNLLRCGDCALWNGSLNGGYPALVDLLGAPLHPLYIIPTLLYGVVNGGKIAIILAMALAGLAQIWLGHVLQIGWAARLWAAGIAVATGSITGRMDLGLTTLMISLASGALIFPAVFSYYKRRTVRAAIVLGGVLTLLIFSGQGYIQIGLAFCSPAFFLLFLGPGGLKHREWVRLVGSLALAGLLSAVLLIPLMHFSPQIEKETNVGLEGLQPLEYQPVNLVVDDQEFFMADALNRNPGAFQYTNFIGWGSIILAILAWMLVPVSRMRVFAFFIVSIALIYLTSSGILLKLAFNQIAPDFLYGIRHAGIIAGLATPLLIGLASWGLDLAFQANHKKDGEIGILNEVRLGRICLILIAISSLSSVYTYGKRWLFLAPLPPEVELTIDHVKEQSATWIEMPPWHTWTVLAIQRDIKLTNMFSPWRFTGLRNPQPQLIVSDDPSEEILVYAVETLGPLTFAEYPSNQYAQVVFPNQASTNCEAEAHGGHVDVDCHTDAPGSLITQEHNLSGWSATIDSQPAQLLPGEWLSVSLPAGDHHVAFRYRPWDVPIGLAISVFGLILASVLWWKGKTDQQHAAAQEII